MPGRIPGAQFVAIEEAGHAVFIDQPSKFDDTLKAFLQAVNR
jgi:pimeloyl-ACP methyl ester carboxylesterase